MKYLALCFISFIAILSLFVVEGTSSLQEKVFARGAKEKRNISSCDLCELVVNSFRKGMTRTAREHFGGGNTAWTEKNLGSYATSETRLVEIQEGLCEEDKATRDVCHTLAEIWEQHLENWWLRDRKTFPDLKHYLCETIIKSCKPTTNTNQRCPLGFTRVVDKGCYDVDECLSNPCKHNEFCMNNEGSFTCTLCHSTCNGCVGSGPDQCKKLKRKRETRNIEEIIDSGKLLNFNTHTIFVLIFTILLALVPSVCCVLIPLLTN